MTDKKARKPKRKYKLTKADRAFYGGQLMRATGRVGKGKYTEQVLMEYLSGPLKGECRWFTEEELKELSD